MPDIVGPVRRERDAAGGGRRVSTASAICPSVGCAGAAPLPAGLPIAVGRGGMSDTERQVAGPDQFVDEDPTVGQT